MQVICDVVLTGMNSGIGQKSGKPWYKVEAVIVGCPEFPLLAGIRLDKFVNEEVYKELCELTTDRFYLSVGVSRVDSGREYDIGLNLFINGLPKDESEPSAEFADVSQPEEVSDKNKKKGGTE